MEGKRLLLVEDEAPLRQCWAEFLYESGFDVVEAEDGDHAVAMLEDIDLLITDVDMPGSVDGNALATYAKARHPGLPVIYASGYPERLCNAIGRNDALVVKPASVAQVAAMVKSLLEAFRNAPHKPLVEV